MKSKIVSILFLLSFFVFGQERFIEGITIDEEGFPTTAEICLIETDLCVETDHNGSFKLNLSNEFEKKEKFKILVVDLVGGSSFNFEVIENQFNELRYPDLIEDVIIRYSSFNPRPCGTIIKKEELRKVNK